MRFSIITVAFNPGASLRETAESVLSQSYENWEMIVKDGGSTDGSENTLPADSRIRYIREKDHGIYDAMNAALPHITGDYVLFLNCGDRLYETETLAKIVEAVEADGRKHEIYFGDVFIRSRKGYVRYPDKIDTYFLMTRSICHQSMVFARQVTDVCRYDGETYRYAADLDYYVQAVMRHQAALKHLPFVVADYEGGGTSETAAHKKKILDEKDQIMRTYLSPESYRGIKRKKRLTGKALKEAVSCHPLLIGPYEKLAALLIRKKN